MCELIKSHKKLKVVTSFLHSLGEFSADLKYTRRKLALFFSDLSKSRLILERKKKQFSLFCEIEEIKFGCVNFSSTLSLLSTQKYK